MSISIRGVLLAVIVWLVPTSLFAGFRTGSDLSHDCKTYVQWTSSRGLPAEEALDATQCLEYIKGAIDAYISAGARNLMKPADSICMPQGFTGEQAVLIVLKYLDNHPENLHLDAGGLVWVAIHSSFACSN
jgi:hypothetical protein